MKTDFQPKSYASICESLMPKRTSSWTTPCPICYSSKSISPKTRPYLQVHQVAPPTSLGFSTPQSKHPLSDRHLLPACYLCCQDNWQSQWRPEWLGLLQLGTKNQPATRGPRKKTHMAAEKKRKARTIKETCKALDEKTFDSWWKPRPDYQNYQTKLG